MSAVRNILIPVDGSDSAQQAFNFYTGSIMKPSDHVLLLHVHQTPHLATISIHEPLKLPTADWSTKLQESIEKSNKLIAHFEMLCEEKKLSKKSLLKDGKPGEAICIAAEEEHVTLVIMGSRGLNAVRRTFMGSVSDYVLHHTKVPVTVVPPSQ